MNVIRKHIVARCLTRLREQKSHTLFAGYLYLQKRASQLGRLKNLEPDFLGFFEQFFLVRNHPLGAPYIKPFTGGKASTKNLWLNENVAGSYAPSSLRPEQPFRQVVDIDGKKYSLPPDHARRAFEHLLYRTPVQVADLAVVLYRDFGLLGDAPTIDDLIDVFAYEFGYASALESPPDVNFQTLFSVDSTKTWDDDWLEPAEIALADLDKLAEQDVRVSPKRTRNSIRSLTADDLLSLKTITAGNQLALQEIVIEGFLSFGQRTQFEFGRLNILVGPNGSGKSNLIDCLRVFRYAPLDIQQSFIKGGFREWLYNGLDKGLGSAFLEITASVSNVTDSIRHRLRLGPPRNELATIEEVISSSGSEEETIQYFVGSSRNEATLNVAGAGKRRRDRKLGESEYDPFKSILSQIRDIEQYKEITGLASLYASFRIYSEWSFGRNSNLREATSAGRSETRLSETMEDLALALNGLEKTAAHEKIRVLLRDLKETYRDYVTRILFGRVGLELVEAPFEQLPLPANRLSDGTLRFLALAAILLHTDPPPLICIEEPELGMHPDMIRMVAGMIVDASSKTQLIVTTHSEYLLTALQDDFDALFAFDTGLVGSIVRRFSREEYEKWRQEHTLGELWTSGELGGNRW